MSNLPSPSDPDSATEPDQENTSKGPNLFVLYAILALAILAAMGVAAMIVWPFYKSIKP